MQRKIDNSDITRSFAKRDNSYMRRSICQCLWLYLLTVTTFKVYIGAGGRKVEYLNLNLCTIYILMVIGNHLNICKIECQKEKKNEI